MLDLTDFVTAARTNEPKVVAAFGERFPRGRLHFPLASREGVRNRPETLAELGPRLPVHRLKLGNGAAAAAIFTSLALCRELAEKLSWTTDGRTIKTLVVPGAVALPYLQERLLSEIERVVINPASGFELHLARTDIEAMASGLPLRSLWFYARDGTLKVPVELLDAAKSTLLGAVLDLAGRALSITEQATFESIPAVDPIPALTAELRELLSREGSPSMEIEISKSGFEVRVAAAPEPPPDLLARVRTVAVKHLAAFPGTAELRLRFEGRSVPAPRPPPQLDYIPLEPEDHEPGS